MPSILIYGESGSGKTTSCQYLDPTTTYYVDCDGKGMAHKGWRQQYSLDNRNYFKSSDVKKIETLINNISEHAPKIKTVVVDTLNAIMVDDEMNRMKEKGYDKWLELATCVYNLINVANAVRDDLTIVFLAHSQTDRDETGFNFTKLKTSGKKLEKIVLESKFTTVIFAKCVDGAYKFQVKNDGTSTVKTPMGVFEDDYIDNNLQVVLDGLKDY